MNLFANRIRTTILLRRDLQGLDAIPEDGHIVINLLNPAEVDLLSEVDPHMERAHAIEKIATGKMCYVARIDGRLAHYSWFQTSGLHTLGGTGRKRRVLEGELWIFSCFTAVWARGKHIFPTMLGRILHDHEALGFHTAWIYVRDSNLASQKAMVRVGFEVVSRLRSLLVHNLIIPLP
jgi:RimJ/RimL family protein N-acetyltransferase